MMKLTKYERPGLVWPSFGRLAGLQDELDRLFESPLTGWAPALDVQEDKDKFTIHVELPGLKREDIEVSLQDGALVISGERNLLEVEELSSNMKRLRELFDLFEQRTALMQLLDVSHRAEGVQIFIGGESGLITFDEFSVVTAPYEVDGQVVGTLGVVGPTRMAYERIIPIVDVTAKLLSSALSQH